MKTVGLVWSGPYQLSLQVQHMWTRLQNRLPEISYRTENTRYIAPFHSRDTDFTYYLTVEVFDHSKIPDGMIYLTIPSRRYATITHSGPRDQVSLTYRSIHNQLSKDGVAPDPAALTVEIYEQAFDPSNNHIEYQIYIPLS